LGTAGAGGPPLAIGSGMLINQPNNNKAPSDAEETSRAQKERFQIFAGNKRAVRNGWMDGSS